MNRKWVATGIMLLFVGVTIVPTLNFNTVKASHDDNLVEVITQACGIKGYGDTIVKLTREQYQNLERYLVEFQAKLNQTSTRQEVVPIFKEAVVELDKYGLLPREMSVSQALKLVLVSFSQEASDLFSNRREDLSQESGNNILCLVSGQLYDSISIYPFLNVLGFLGEVLYDISYIPKLMMFLYLAYRQNVSFPNLIKMLLFCCEFLTVPFDLFETYILQCMIVSNIGPQSLRNIVGIGFYQKFERGY